MGDFNDTPSNKSLVYLNDNENIKLLECKHGTHKYQGKWSKLDHFFISNSLLKNHNYSVDGETNVCKQSFLLEKDKKHLGYKPFRTFVGFNYNGGFSDHLPIFIDLVIE